MLAERSEEELGHYGAIPPGHASSGPRRGQTGARCRGPEDKRKSFQVRKLQLGCLRGGTGLEQTSQSKWKWTNADLAVRSDKRWGTGVAPTLRHPALDFHSG